MERRSRHLREDLHVSVSAAAVTADGGEAFKRMDESLEKATGRKRAAEEHSAQAGAQTLGAAHAAKLAAQIGGDVEHLWARN